MKVIKENNLTKIEASTNHYIANKELTNIYGISVYLGKYSKESDYVEITETQKDEILKKLEKEEKERQAKIKE